MSNIWAEKNPEEWKAYKKAWEAKNGDKVKAHRAAYRAKHADKLREAQRAHYLAKPEIYAAADRKKKYGLTRADFEAMLAEQKGLCAACADPLLPGRGTHVDHCHGTGRVRDLLCKDCNLALGHAKESPARLIALAAYINKHKSLEAGAEA